ncbi:MAG TPA: amidohydrolase [Kofleriaceae bacterium]|nr:amidohydrolase [Kofleriaceae bacterium]
MGGDIVTNNPDQPRVTALALRGNRVLAVGDDAAVRALVGPETRVVELAGKTVTPGLVDGHCHLYGMGTAAEQVNLKGMASAQAAAEAVAAAAKGRPAGEWIAGRGWDQNPWGGEFPTRATLDALLGDRPVMLRRVDGHASWVNTAALKLAGVTRATPDPAGGKIVRDASGEPTGVFIDAAMDLVDKHVPAPTREARERRIRAAADLAVSVGLTGVHEMGIEDATVEVYRELGRAGELPLRVNAYLEGSPAIARTLGEREVEPDDGDAYFSLVGMKLFADGALGSRGAALAADYTDDEGNRGLWVTQPADLKEATIAASAAGWQVATHAIGDAAVHATLDAYEAAEASQQGTDLRLRVEHAQIMTPDDIERLARLGVIASMQPTHATSDMPWAEQRIGPERIKGAYAWRSVLAAGGLIVAGSDFPVEEVSPMFGLYAAVTRQDPKGSPAEGWYPAQRMTLEEAIFAFTAAPAVAGFVEEHRGRLVPGFVADVTVFDRTLAPDKTLLDTRPLMTIVGGEVVFEQGAPGN